MFPNLYHPIEELQDSFITEDIREGGPSTV